MRIIALLIALSSFNCIADNSPLLKEDNTMITLIGRTLVGLGIFESAAAVGQSTWDYFSTATMPWNNTEVPVESMLSTDELVDIQQGGAALIRIMDMIAYMETNGNTGEFIDNPVLPHFLVAASTEQMVKLKNDTSYGVFGLTAIGTAEGTNRYAELNDLKSSNNPDEQIAANAKLAMLDAVGQHYQAEYGIVPMQVIISALLLKSNYVQHHKRDASFKDMANDLPATYAAWNRGPTSAFNDRIKQYETDYILSTDRDLYLVEVVHTSLSGNLGYGS